MRDKLWWLGVKVGDYVIGQNFIAEVMGSHGIKGKALRRLHDGETRYVNKENFRAHFRKCKCNNIIRYLYV